MATLPYKLFDITYHLSVAFYPWPKRVWRLGFL